MGEEPSERPVALAATDRALPVRIAAIEDERAPEGMACIGSFLGPRLVARCVLPPDAAAFLLDRGLFAQPVRLALAAREESPGLQCQLFALVERPDDFCGGEDEEEDARGRRACPAPPTTAPWRRAPPTPPAPTTMPARKTARPPSFSARSSASRRIASIPRISASRPWTSCAPSSRGR